MPAFDVVSNADAAYGFMTQFFQIARTEQMKGICLMRDDEVIAATVYDEYNGQNVWLHCAGKPGRKWLTRDFLMWSFHYPFEQLRVSRVSLWIDANNAASIRFAEHLGFTREATLERAGREGGDVYIYRMFREDCRYV